MSDHVYVLNEPTKSYVKVFNDLARSPIDATHFKVLVYLMTHDPKFSVSKGGMSRALDLDKKTISSAIMGLETGMGRRKKFYGRFLVRQSVIRDGVRVGTNYFVSSIPLTDEQVATYGRDKLIGKGESSASVVGAVGGELFRVSVPDLPVEAGNRSTGQGNSSPWGGEWFPPIEDQEKTNPKEDQPSSTSIGALLVLLSDSDRDRLHRTHEFLTLQGVHAQVEQMMQDAGITYADARHEFWETVDLMDKQKTGREWAEFIEQEIGKRTLVAV
ncbi:hypothetical protein [Gordonia sp. DT101]|uniref:hypothetical protein n=1 Tax=Gordonia sp. DT101 TaxID=3416545 RepID=UPI003CEBFBA0